MLFCIPVTRTCSRQATTRSDRFAYNDRSELVSASLGTTPYAYAYDNIGNRETAEEAAQAITSYTTNPLNQYSGITQGSEIPFLPEYDVAGNQTKIKTSTGIWAVVYDANNRPTSFTSEDGQTLIDCGYDYMGRRFMKKVTANGAVTLHQFYLYRGYLQIAALDLTRSNLPALWFTHWDPTEPVATRPLSIRKNATWYTYGHDLTKNVTELYTAAVGIATAYDYTPYGAVTTADPDQPFQWSSEVYDAELGMIYYNYRHYNPSDGRWINRDPIDIRDGWNRYTYIKNKIMRSTDYNGLVTIDGGFGKLSNCFGYAVSGKTNLFAYPLPTSPGEPRTSFIDEMNNSKSGWKCKVVGNYSECMCPDECHEKMLVTLYENKNKPTGKNPFEDPDFPWDLSSQTSDIHAIRSTIPNSSQYTEIPCTGPSNRKPNKVTKKTLNNLFDGNSPLMCCCKKKQS